MNLLPTAYGQKYFKILIPLQDEEISMLFLTSNIHKISTCQNFEQDLKIYFVRFLKYGVFHDLINIILRSIRESNVFQNRTDNIAIFSDPYPCLDFIPVFFFSSFFIRISTSRTSEVLFLKNISRMSFRR